jgi:hypothetical protein
MCLLHSKFYGALGQLTLFRRLVPVQAVHVNSLIFLLNKLFRGGTYLVVQFQLVTFSLNLFFTSW